LLRERAGSTPLQLGWQMRVPPGSSFVRQSTGCGLGRGF
jgi:hypothetical protein